MKVTGALLAESAKVVAGKLNVEGGLLRDFEVGPDRIARMTLVVLTEFESGDSAPGLSIEFVRPSGDSQDERIEMPPQSVAPAGDIGFAYWPLWVPVEQDGRYLLVVRGDAGSVTLPLTVRG